MLHFVVDTIMHGYNTVEHSTTGANNSPVSRKQKYLRNVNEYQSTKIAQLPGAVLRP